MQYSPAGMSTFPGKGITVSRRTGKGYIDLIDKKILNQGRSVVSNDFDSLYIGNSISCLHNIVYEKLRGIIDASRNDSSLCIIGIRFFNSAMLCYHNDVQPLL